MNPKAAVLLSLATTQFAAGALAQYSRPANSYALTVPLLLLCSLLIFAWYRLDCDERGYRRSALLDTGVAALALIALPWYFFRSRGAMRGGLATLVFLMVLVGFSLVSVAGQVVAYMTMRLF